jgi:hypothetical protein
VALACITIMALDIGAVHARRTLLVIALLFAAGVCIAQFGPRRRSRSSFEDGGHLVQLEGGLVVNEDDIHTARETASHSSGTPDWTNAPGFEDDVFTFTRVIFHNDPSPRVGRRGFRWLGWWVDYPDADLNLSYRLQQLTTIRTDPDARVIKFTDAELARYPLIYIEHAGYMQLSKEEIAALRKFFLSGGAMLVNDFWGAEEWNGFASALRDVLPGRAWTELTTEHPVFNSVYDLRKPMRHLQVPTIQFWNPEHDPNDPDSELHRIFRGEGSKDMHVRALLDDHQRMMVLAIHNSDVSDGWEREGENEDYFRRYSERIAYPLGINIIVYLMTH